MKEKEEKEEKVQKPADVKLRAFKIINTEIAKNHSDVRSILSEKLKDTIVKERGMPINEEDPLNETDYIAYYKINGDITFGAVVKTIASEDAPNITEDMMDKNNIVISDLNRIGEKTNIVKYLYYFAMSDKHIVTNLRSQQCISPFQTYINWFLEKERGDKQYYFQPMIVKQQVKDINNIKGIKFHTPKKGVETQKIKDGKKETPMIKKIKDIQKDVLTFLIPKDIPNFNEIIEEDFISAEILLKFAPKKKDKEKYEAAMGVLLNNISDPDSVSLNTKKGNIKLGDVELKKIVNVQKTESGLLSEQELYQKMEEFIKELDKK